MYVIVTNSYDPLWFFPGDRDAIQAFMSEHQRELESIILSSQDSNDESARQLWHVPQIIVDRNDPSYLELPGKCLQYNSSTSIVAYMTILLL